MSRVPISIDRLLVRAHHLWAEQWMALAAGDFAKGRFNAMAVGWGSLGTMWGKPFAQVVVRPQRYTREFMDAFDTFTLCAFPESERRGIQVLGTKSGRDGNKFGEAGLTPTASSVVAAPCFLEAELVIECRKLYWQDLDPEHFLSPAIAQNYPNHDYHRVYFGEILAVTGIPPYAR
jgi:flavin reductase (DIM6/NTAB) family NADH-FMN oxidoreductase RutF